MFDKFGDMSREGINTLAENLYNEGDLQSLKEMAAENGIPEELVEMYTNGEIMELCDAMTAAMGKLEMEEAELKPQDIMVDWLDYIKALCMEQEDIAEAVRRPGKSLTGCIADILKYAFAHQIEVDKDIVKAAGVNAGRVTLGMPGQAQVRKIIRAYYR